jgi:hypothetical protein
MPPSWGTRTGAIPRAVGISKSDFNDVEELIQSLRRGTREFDAAMNLAAQLAAKTSQGFVQRSMRGPVTQPSQARRTPSTFQIPVRRITSRTYQGWRVRRLSMGMWELFNEERGAWAIEFGVVRGGHGRRRPVLKMSAVATLRFIQRTRFGNRIYHGTFGELRNNRGHFRSFVSRMQGSSVLGVSGPTGYLP